MTNETYVVDISETMKVWIVWQNTDLTEGKGIDIPLYTCKKRATAIRLSKSKYVQGSNCPITEEEIYRIRNKWFSPCNLINPTKEDLKEDMKLTAGEQAINKALKAGLSVEEIEAITRM